MKRLGHALEKIDERIPGIDLPLMSVSQTRGVIRRSELTDMPQRAESLDEYKVCREGDIVFNKMKIRSGAMGVAPEDGLVTYHYEVMRLRDGMDARYIVHLMKSSWFTSELIARSAGYPRAANTAEYVQLKSRSKCFGQLKCACRKYASSSRSPTTSIARPPASTRSSRSSSA